MTENKKYVPSRKLIKTDGTIAYVFDNKFVPRYNSITNEIVGIDDENNKIIKINMSNASVTSINIENSSYGEIVVKN